MRGDAKVVTEIVRPGAGPVTASIEFGGAVFDERTDWRDVVRHPYLFLYRPFERDLDAASALGALAEALRGTPLEVALGDAALEVIEQGDEIAMEAVFSTAWEKAPTPSDGSLRLSCASRAFFRTRGCTGASARCSGSRPATRAY